MDGEEFRNPFYLGNSVSSNALLTKVANHARIGCTVSPHVCRHTVAVAAVQKGISLPALPHLLGHRHLITTEISVNLSPEEVVRALRETW